GKGKSGAVMGKEEEEVYGGEVPPPHGRGHNDDGAGDAVPSHQDFEREVREVRAYWQRHEEEFAEMHLPYEDMPMLAAYDDLYGDPYGDQYGGPEGYDDGYGYGMY
ncbi:hypothetical protein Vafri_4178, partial [Volvox africanus]